MRYFHELSPDEQDIAIEKVFRQISNDYKVVLLRSGQYNVLDYDKAINDELWDIAGMLAEDALYIPDDGSRVVRL